MPFVDAGTLIHQQLMLGHQLLAAAAFLVPRRALGLLKARAKVIEIHESYKHIEQITYVYIHIYIYIWCN